MSTTRAHFLPAGKYAGMGYPCALKAAKRSPQPCPLQEDVLQHS